MILRLSIGRFFGNIVNKKEFNSFILTEKIHRQGEKLPKHSHKNAYLSFVLSGRWLESRNNKELEYSRNNLVYHPLGEIHSDHFKHQDVHLFNIQFPVYFLTRIHEISKEFTDPVSICHVDTIFLAKKIYKEFRFSDDMSFHIIEGLLLELFAHISRSRRIPLENQKPKWIKISEEMINENIFNNLSISEIAVRLNVHPVYFIRTFRKYYNCTPGEYKRKRIIEAACNKLLYTNQSLTEIALDVGFSDQSHFTKTFKRFIGLSPYKYRKHIKS